MSLIRLVGIELEGGWDRVPPSRIHEDGSVTADGNYRRGEISSPPLKRSDIAQWVEANYPDNVNASCGLHVHTSIRNVGRYSQLMNPGFYRYWKDAIAKWGRVYPVKNEQFWGRLRGQNSYCEDSWNPDIQARARSKGSERYALLNFCYSLHGTLECRALPMFRDWPVAVAAINAHLDIVERYLATLGKRFTVASSRQSGQVEFGEPPLEVSESIEAGVRVPSPVAVETNLVVDLKPKSKQIETDPVWRHLSNCSVGHTPECGRNCNATSATCNCFDW